MAEGERPPETPDRDALCDIAPAHAGHFTTQQAVRAGYSPQLLAYYRDNGVERVRRGISRLVHFPASEHEDLVVFWLWSELGGVFSHETALALHDLSDILPSRVQRTLPASWRRRRLRAPTGLVLSCADIGDGDRSSFDAVPVTGPRRALGDGIEAHVEPRLVEEAIRQERRGGLVSATDETRLLGDLVGVDEAPAP